ncbi:hypothetical protein ACLBYD_22400 [Rhodococcus sp. C26F]
MVHDTFIKAIHEAKKVRLTFFSKEDRSPLTRICAPMDFGPSRITKDRQPRYHFWNFDSDKKSHTLSLPANQVISIELTNDTFDPSEFITWDINASPWHVARNWGAYS